MIADVHEKSLDYASLGSTSQPISSGCMISEIGKTWRNGNAGRKQDGKTCEWKIKCSKDKSTTITTRVLLSIGKQSIANFF